MEEQPLIYTIEERGHKWIYHWFIFMVAGMKDIDNSNYPIYFTAPITQEFQKETLELLEPEFKYVDKIPEGSKVINNYGSKLITPYSVDYKYYEWLRNFILKKMPLRSPANLKGRYYISRHKAPLLECNKGEAKRVLINEEEVFNSIYQFGFQKIYLEDYKLKDKIKLFQESEIIITPNGGGLTMGLFAAPELKIIEISHPDSSENMYKVICENRTKFTRYTNVLSVDQNNNLTPYSFIGQYCLRVNDIHHFSNFVKDFLK
jgi:capsular polysaccharide biosynthesis protein